MSYPCVLDLLLNMTNKDNVDEPISSKNNLTEVYNLEHYLFMLDCFERKKSLFCDTCVTVVVSMQKS